MIFEVRLSVVQRISYVIGEIALIVYTVFFACIFKTALSECSGTPELFVTGAIAISIMGLMLYCNYRVLDSLLLRIRVDRRDKTLDIKRFLFFRKVVQVYELSGWGIKIGHAKHGRETRTVVIDYSHLKVRILDTVFANADVLEGFLMANAPGKRNRK